MQLKECTEDTADNKVRGDWMLINLCVLHSAQYFCISSSLLSCSWLSRPPLKGMTRAPGSWPSTHSLIFSSLAEMETRRVKSVRFNTGGFVILGCMNIHGGEAERVYGCLWEIALWRWSFCFVTLHFKQWKVSKECDIKWILAFVYSENVLQTECSNSDVL